MPFSASNGHKTKLIRPEINFPIRYGKEIIAVLSIDELFPDVICVNLLREGVTINFGNGLPEISHNIDVDRKSFLIQYKGRAVKVNYLPDEQFD